MSRILLVIPNFYPEKTGIGVTATDCAVFLKELGHDVEVLTSVPYYPEWSIHPGYRGKLFSKEIFQGISVHRVWLYVPAKVKTAGRIIHEISFALLVMMRMLFCGFDRVLCITPPLSAAAAVAIVAKLKRKPYWLYIKDIQPDAAICLGMLTNPFVIAVSRFLERFIYAASARILVLSEGMKENLLKKGVEASRLSVVPDSIDVNELNLPPAPRETRQFRKTLGLQNKFIALYSGNIGVKQNPEIIVEVARRLKDNDSIFFAVVGEGALRARLAEMIEEYKLTNIAIYPLCERELLGDMLAAANVLLMPQCRAVLDIVVPSKLLSYLTSGTAVVASVHPESEAARVLRDAEAGEVVDAEDVDAFAKAILRLQNDPARAERLGANGLTLIKTNYAHQVVKELRYRPLFAQP